MEERNWLKAMDAVVAERDQLRQQVEKLLRAVDAHRSGTSFAQDNLALYKLADQVRRELGE